MAKIAALSTLLTSVVEDIVAFFMAVCFALL